MPRMKSMGVGSQGWRQPTAVDMAYYNTLLGLAGCCFAVSFSYLPVLIIEPHGFGLSFSAGSLAAMMALATRSGRIEFLAARCTPSEMPFTVTFCLAVVGTLLGAATASYLLSLVCAAAQFAVLSCRWEQLHGGIRRGVRGPSRGGTGLVGRARTQWNTILRTPSQYNAYAMKYESLNYDHVHSELESLEHAAFGYDKMSFYGFSGAAVGRWILTAACGILIGLVAFFMTKSIECITEWKMEQLTARIKVEFMIETGGREDVPLQEADGVASESLFEALDFEYDAECAAIASKVQCGDLSTGAEHCYWDDEDEIPHTNGTCYEDKLCCVEKAGSPIIFFFAVNTALALLACLPVVLFSSEAAGSGIPEVMGYLNGVHIRRLLKLRTLMA